MPKVHLYEVEITGREVSEHGVMQSGGIGRVKGYRHIGSNLSSMRENVSKVLKNIMAYLDHIVGRMEVRDRIFADVARKYERVGASVPKESFVSRAGFDRIIARSANYSVDSSSVACLVACGL
jgi:hypothetical protein